MNKLSCIIQMASTWHEIHESLCENAKAGLLFEEFCKLFYLTEPSVKNDYKNVWKFHELPTHIKERLGLGKTDHGVDIVLEGIDGSLTAVQCKFKNNQSYKLSWTKDKLANLFAEGNKADYLIVFTNASGIDKHSKSKERLTIVTGGNLVNLSATTIEQIKLLANEEPIRPVEPKQPRDYQIEAITNVIKGFSQNDRGQLILPCGAGKTLVSFWIKNSLQAKHTLVLVPSLALLKQIKDEWTSNSSYTPRICVCSEKDIDKGSDSTIANIYEIGGQVSTDPAEIKSFILQHEKSIVYSTYQSLEKIASALKGTDFKFDLAICDEAHKTAGNKLGKNGLIHSDACIPVKKRLYMTATPRVLSSALKNTLSDESASFIQDMSNPDIFGKEFHRMSFKEAIEKKILVDYQIVAIGVTEHEIQDAITQRKYISDNETIDEIANNYALAKFMDSHQSTHAITFHSSVKKSKAFKVRHEQLDPDTTTYHVNGTQSTNERKVIIGDFVRSIRSVITNSRCLTEGVDVPAIDAVYFCDPKYSKLDIIQATGRALRRADFKDKKLGYVIVPIFHHIDEDVENVIAKNPFHNLIAVVRALTAHDERLFDEINKIKAAKGQNGRVSEILSISEELDFIKFEFFEEALKNNLFSQIIKKSSITFVGFYEAREFARSLNLTNKRDWHTYIKFNQIPYQIPKDPYGTYKFSGWTSWGDFLETGNVAVKDRALMSFYIARDIARKLNLENSAEWLTYCKSGKKPIDIPAYPNHAYKEKGWISWDDWLDYSTKAFLPFEDAREFVRALKLTNQKSWDKFAKNSDRPRNIPAAPHITYKNKGWVNMGDWLGTRNIAYKNRIYRNYESAKAFVHKLGLKTSNDWKTYTKSGDLPHDIPAYPAGVYKNTGWVSMMDWLGTNQISKRNRVYKLFEEAREYARSLRLNGYKDWIKHCREHGIPNDIPTYPDRIYRDTGWLTWSDWVNNGFNKFRDFNDSKEYARSTGLNSSREWMNHSKAGLRPKDIPAAPHLYYKNKGWKSWPDWFGTE